MFTYPFRLVRVFIVRLISVFNKHVASVSDEHNGIPVYLTTGSLLDKFNMNKGRQCSILEYIVHQWVVGILKHHV